MKKLACFLSIALLTSCWITPAPAHAQATAHASSQQPSDMKLNVELLTDTNGTNIDLYMKNLISSLRKHWLPPVTETANQPLANQPPLEQQEALITLTIAPDGHLLAMKLEDAAHDTAFDKAAWKAAKETSYLPPPAGMRDPNLKLRVHFVVN